MENIGGEIMKIVVRMLAILLLLCLVFPNLSSANKTAFVVSQSGGWSDDFNDGNIDGWTVQGWNRTADPPTALPGNFTADDYTLRAYDDETNQAYHTSTVAYGSWVFDYHSVPTPNNHSYVAFVSGPATEFDGPGWEATVPYEYGIVVVNGEFASFNNTFILYRRNQGNINVIPLGEHDVDVVSGWYHINITRDFEGNFEVYFNDTLEITAVETGYTTSEIFSFYTHAGPALDNIVVTPREPETTTSTTTTTTTTTQVDGEPLDITLLLIAGGVIAVVVVLVVIIRSRK